MAKCIYIYISTVFLLAFETVPTVWYVLFFILFQHNYFPCIVFKKKKRLSKDKTNDFTSGVVVLDVVHVLPVYNLLQ